MKPLISGDGLKVKTIDKDMNLVNSQTPNHKPRENNKPNLFDSILKAELKKLDKK